MAKKQDIPFVDDILTFLKKGAPSDIRKAIEKAGKDDILDPGYPYTEEMKGAVQAVCKIFGPNVKWYFFWSFLLYLGTGGVMLLSRKPFRTRDRERMPCR